MITNNTKHWVTPRTMTAPESVSSNCFCFELICWFCFYARPAIKFFSDVTILPSFCSYWHKFCSFLCSMWKNNSTFDYTLCYWMLLKTTCKNISHTPFIYLKKSCSLRSTKLGLKYLALYARTVNKTKSCM